MNRRHGLARLNPTARLVVFMVISLASTLSNNRIWVLTFLLIGVLLLITGKKYPKPALVATVNVFILTFAGHALFARENIVVSFLVFNVSRESVARGLLLGLRIVAMMLVAIAYAASTPRHEIYPAVHGIRIPKVAAVYLMVLIRYVDVLWYELQVSMKAMKIRGVEWTRSPLKRVAAFRQLMTPMFYRMLSHIEGQALAIDARGGVRVGRAAVEVSKGAPAVEMLDVSVRYGLDDDPATYLALKGVSLKVEPGERVVLLGPTGAGKSTILLLCAGLIPQSTGRMKGEVQLFGHDTKATPMSDLARLARIVFPSAVQGLVGLTVKDELELSLRASLIPTEEHAIAMKEALQSVGLDVSFLQRLTLGLSGGEMQRVALASAVIAQPRLLLLDEVTVQLDPRGRREMISALLTIRGADLPTVLTDPTVSLVQATADRYALLENGHVSKAGQIDLMGSHELRRGHVRVPQLRRLWATLGRGGTPSGVQEAVRVLRPVSSIVVSETRQDSAEILLSAEGVSFSYNGIPALRDVSIRFHYGEFTALLGANGSGKTTLGLVLAQALEPSSGKVLLDNKPTGPQSLGQIGYVFQEPMNQMLTMSVADELAFGPKQLAWPEEHIRRVVERELQRFELGDQETLPLDLSPAKQRQLAIASVLAMEPRVLILDEPTNGLDEAESHQLLVILESLKAEGITIILITHDVEIACEHADRVTVMKDGGILIDGPTRQVMAQPEILAKSDVIVPDVIALALELWPNHPPALTVEELAEQLAQAEQQRRP